MDSQSEMGKCYFVDGNERNPLTLIFKFVKMFKFNQNREYHLRMN